MNKIKGVSFTEQGDSVLLSCGAGEFLDDVVAAAVARGCWGLENLSAIPGTVGATPIQNVGAYGVEVSQLISAVTAVHSETLKEKVFTPAECQFGYRDSFFKTPAGRVWVVTAVSFTLATTPTPQLQYGALAALQKIPDLTPQHVRDAVIEIRSGKFPDWHVVGTAGSFFKNPIIPQAQFAVLQQQYPELPGFPAAADTVKVSLGWILDHVCALRGHERNGVSLFEKQALVLVAKRGVQAATIDAFANDVAVVVKEKTGIVIEREVRSVS